jgi:hypothetical protein
MELKDAIQQAEKLLAHNEKKHRPPTKSEREAIKRLVEHAATSAK